MLYTVYILYSLTADKIYIGYTSNLLERFKSHNYLSPKGFTLKYRPWTVIYCEYYETKMEAAIREKQLKGGQGREWIRTRITNDFAVKGFISA